MKKLTVLVAAIALAAVLAAAAASGSEDPGGTETATKSAKCKKLKGKAKKKCRRKQRHSSGPTAARPEITLECVSGCLVDYAGHPLAADDGAPLSFRAHLAPDAGNSLLSVSYRTGHLAETAHTESLTTDAAGDVTVSFSTENGDQYYDSSVTASFAGGPGRAPATRTLAYYVVD